MNARMVQWAPRCPVVTNSALAAHLLALYELRGSCTDDNVLGPIIDEMIDNTRAELSGRRANAP